MNSAQGRAVFLDRDGTLFGDYDYLDDPDKIRIYNGTFSALRRIRAKGWKIIVGTNQSGIGRGYFSHGTVRKIHARLIAVCRKNRVKIDKIYYCPHHPKVRCSCRKPKTGMLAAAARRFSLDLKRCVVVGDKKCDVDWGRAVGAKTVLVLTGYGRTASAATRRRAHRIAKSLAHAAPWILRQ